MANASSLRIRVADLAQTIIGEAKKSAYTHTIYIDAETGVYDVDCSGFVSYILQETAENHLAMIPGDSVAQRPLARDYYNFFADLSAAVAQGWRGIMRLADARSGDLIAWRLPDMPQGDTGHIFVVADTPVSASDGYLAVSVYDASDILHFDDSRGSGRDQFRSGVGTGVIKFQADRDGAPTAFQFNADAPFVTTPIAIGRTEPFSLDS